jgi:hypothetical protein
MVRCGRVLLTWVLVLELGEVVDVLVDNDEQGIRLVMRRDVARLECLRHVGRRGVKGIFAGCDCGMGRVEDRETKNEAPTLGIAIHNDKALSSHS